ncbi:precorrin-4/cobalt-precorrin-4 C11-methyltransferase [Geothermobacter ehrlichii]|uniref:Precorrin-4/cobalt-precorrin-4 C11-methyltransferase n=1 Tax=Geothermobacter ehrlichii TaxID=213224 RepID=A0A5D3WMK7_9BACT|nr:SAM-dependent methyltransferase [Geothermobacter ehrlichii]TYP00233.1 precorrin-4/cobalt-precorrin-4 C11-methyltransferase [Geothermobacter ehrlichii]
MFPVYFIGAGPGDPGMLTLDGARALEDSATVYAPEPYGETFAKLLQGKQILIPFDYSYEELIARVRSESEQAPVSFLVPGDLTFYSPFQPFIDALGERVKVLPGVGIANAAAARLGKTLDLPGVCNRAIIASPRTLGDGPDAPTLEELAAPGVTLLIYMNNIPLPELVAVLRRGYGKNVPMALLHRIGLPGEEIVLADLDTMAERVGDRDFFNLGQNNPRPSLTLVIVGETLTAEPGGDWWNWRWEHVWKHRA